MKGQTGLEFMMVFSLGILVFALVQWQYAQNQEAFRQETNQVFAQDLADRWANQIQDVSYRDGFQLPMQVPSTLAGQESFSLRLTNNSAEVSWQNHSVVSSFATVWLLNQTGQSNFLLPAGNYLLQSLTDRVIVHAA